MYLAPISAKGGPGATRERPGRRARLTFSCMGAALAMLAMATPAAGQGTAPAGGATKILCLFSDPPTADAAVKAAKAELEAEAANTSSTCTKRTIAMGGNLVVLLDATTLLRATDWRLRLNGLDVLDPADTPLAVPGTHTLIFKLRRSEKTKDAWTKILGSPNLQDIPVVATLVSEDGKTTLQANEKADEKYSKNAQFLLNVVLTPWLGVAVVTTLLLGAITVRKAWTTTVIRDNLLPQIPVRERPFSLGRFQMAFWFLLVIESFLFLWALLWDYNTVTSQALTLMGISAATGAGALSANSTNDGGVTAADTALRAAGFTQPGDIVAARAQLAAALAANPPVQATVDALTARVSAYTVATQNYVTATYNAATGTYNYRGILTDMINDQDGPALHRLQMLGWTLALGVVFLVGIYRDLAMPEFSTTLLALIGVSGASYVGFKIPERT